MSRRARALFLEATGLFSAPAEPVAAAFARALLANPGRLAGLVRCGDGGLEVLAIRQLRRATEAAGADLGAVQAWLTGQGPRPPDPPPRRPVAPARPGLPFLRARPARLPEQAVVLKAGLRGWEDARWQALLRGRPDLAVVALLEAPLARGWPEYAEAAEVAALPARLRALAAGAHRVLVPDQASRQALAAEAVMQAPGAPPVAVHPVPSILAGGQGLPPEPVLAVVPFFLVIDRIEARANTALLLQLWRDAVRRDDPVPRLVLAGERGPLAEEIRPLLGWNEGLRATVAEAPGLSAAALRHLARHARAVLAPAFDGCPVALLTDLDRLGVRVIASDCPAHREAGLSTPLLDPIDGPAWRGAIGAAAELPPAPRPDASLDAALDLDRILADVEAR